MGAVWGRGDEDGRLKVEDGAQEFLILNFELVERGRWIRNRRDEMTGSSKAGKRPMIGSAWQVIRPKK
jgi:hypothetical protein